MNHTFVKEQAYKLKLTFKARKITYYFQKIRTEGEQPTYEFTANQDGSGNHIWLLDEHIESVESPSPKKPKKAKKPTTCNRCYGAGRFEHMKHVDNGICYKCKGAGVI